MKHALHWVSNRWLKLAGYIIIGVSLTGLFMVHLGTLVPGISVNEQAAINNTSSIERLAENPLYAPHKVVTYSVQKFATKDIRALRAISVAFGMITVVLLYLFLRNWRTERIAVFGATLMATSSWFLNLARLATPQISASLFIMSLILWLYCLSYSKEYPKLILYTGVVLMALSLYVPGLVWLIAGIIIWQFSNLRLLVKRARWTAVLPAILIFIVAVLPLVYSMLLHHSLIKMWLLLPMQWPAIETILHNMLKVPLALFWQSPPDPVFGLASIPFLDVFSFVMLALGAWQWKRDLSVVHRVMGIIMVVGSILLLALNDRATYMMLALPLVYVTVTAGVTILLQQWFTVFPRNPLARNVGVALLAITIGIVAFYHLNRYFVAWPNAPETKAAFSISAPTK